MQILIETNFDDEMKECQKQLKQFDESSIKYLKNVLANEQGKPNDVSVDEWQKILKNNKDEFNSQAIKTITLFLQQQNYPFEIPSNYSHKSDLQLFLMILIITLITGRSKQQLHRLFQPLFQKFQEKGEYFDNRLKRIQEFFELVCDGYEHQALCLWFKNERYKQNFETFTTHNKIMAAQFYKIFYKIYNAHKIYTPISLLLKQMKEIDLNKTKKGSHQFQQISNFNTLQYANHITKPVTPHLKIILDSLNNIIYSNKEQPQIKLQKEMMKRPSLNLIALIFYIKHQGKLNEQFVNLLRQKCYKSDLIQVDNGEFKYEIEMWLQEILKFSCGSEKDFYCGVLFEQSFEEWEKEYKETDQKIIRTQKNNVNLLKSFCQSYKLSHDDLDILAKALEKQNSKDNQKARSRSKHQQRQKEKEDKKQIKKQKRILKLKESKKQNRKPENEQQNRPLKQSSDQSNGQCESIGPLVYYDNQSNWIFNQSLQQKRQSGNQRSLEHSNSEEQL